MTRLARFATSGQRAFEVMRRRDWLVVMAAFVTAMLLFSVLLVAQLDAYRARSQAAEQAQAQASIVADQRAAQSRRIDGLSRQLADAQEELRVQAVVVGRQEQAVRDLAVQVAQMGGQPVATRVAPERTATRTPHPTTAPTTAPARSSKPASKPSPRATSSPKPAPSTAKPAPVPEPVPDPQGGLLTPVCDLLPLITC